MKRLLSLVLVFGLGAALASDAFAGGGRVGKFRHTPIIKSHVVHHGPHSFYPPVHICYRVEYSCSLWRCRHFHCELDARRFADYVCGLGFEHRIVCQGGCFVVHYHLHHCQTRTFDHRCVADSFVNRLCGYGIHAHVIVVRH